jgi:hypothetical protein
MGFFGIGWKRNMAFRECHIPKHGISRKPHSKTWHFENATFQNMAFRESHIPKHGKRSAEGGIFEFCGILTKTS